MGSTKIETGQTELVAGPEHSPVEPCHIPVAANGADVGRLLEMAIAADVDVAKVEALVELQLKLVDRAARTAFNQAVARFRAACPRIVKRHENTQFKVTRNGVKRDRRYADLEDIAATIDPILPDHGLSYRWGDAVLSDGHVCVKCIVTHEAGHSESSAATMPCESKAGCSEVQKVYAATTYARRLSLVSAFGLTAFDDDDDGNQPPSTETITDKQIMDIEDLLSPVDPADRQALLEWCRVKSVSEIVASDYNQVVASLKRKVEQK